MNWWKPKQSPMQSSSSDPPPRQPHHGRLNEAFHNLQSKLSSFLQNSQNFFFKQEFNISNRDIIPVYHVRFSDDEIALMAPHTNRWKTMLGYFLSKTDAKAYAEHGFKEYPQPSELIPYVDSEGLDSVISYNYTATVPIKFIPDASEVKNALEVKKKAGLPHKNFSGIPVFESRDLSLCQGYLKLKSEGSCLNPRRPVFFKRADLEKSLAKAKARVASRDGESKLIDKETHIEVAALEDILQAMKDNSISEWNNIFFVYPGEDAEKYTRALKMH